MIKKEKYESKTKQYMQKKMKAFHACLILKMVNFQMKNIIKTRIW